MWLPIFITVLAAAGNNIGKVLQKQGTRSLPKLVLQPAVLKEYMSNSVYMVGLLADLGGAVLMVAAFAMAPVSVVQPVSAVGLVILMVFSHFYLKERLRPEEWAAAIVAFIGVLGLGGTAEPDHLDDPDHLHPARIILTFLAMVALLGLECWWRHNYTSSSSTTTSTISQVSNRSSSSGEPRRGAAAGLPVSTSHSGHSAAGMEAVYCGLEGGACFGFSAAACRTGFVLARRTTWLFAPLGLVGSVMLTSSGFVLQTKGLKAGNTVVVCSMAAASSMVTGVLAGLLALHEKMPSKHHLRAVRLFSWAAIFIGVTSLAGGKRGLQSFAKALAALLGVIGKYMPAGVRKALPTSMSAALGRAQKQLEAMSEAGHDPDDYEDVEALGIDRDKAQLRQR